MARREWPEACDGGIAGRFFKKGGGLLRVALVEMAMNGEVGVGEMARSSVALVAVNKGEADRHQLRC